MTKPQITESTGWVIRTGAVVASVLTLCIWFNTRLSAVEIAQAEGKTKMDMILEIVRDIRTDIRKP
jgi:hypothetical protein